MINTQAESIQPEVNALGPVTEASSASTGNTKKITTTKKSLLTLLHLCTIATFAAFLFWGAQGKAPVNGDDVRVIHRTQLKQTKMKYDYLAWTTGRMHTAALLYEEYKIAGDSIERGSLIWLGIYVLSAFAGYLYLRKIFNPSTALTGAIYYLCYSSKYEVLTWWSAGAYTLIWLAFFGLLGVLESKWSYRAKTIAITAIVGLSLYIYEVFALIIPFISLVLLMRRKREIGCLKRSDWLLACAPIFVFVIHVATLSLVPNPIFLFDRSTVGKASVVERVATGFTSALDATVGPKHNLAVHKASRSFKNFYRKDEPILNVLLWSAAGLFVAGLILSAKWSLSFAPNMVSISETALLGSVALFASGIIGFVSNFLVTPSRLTGIPSIGLMMLVCVGLEFLFWLARGCSGKKKIALTAVALIAPIVVLVFTMREAQAFCSLLRQSSEVEEFDLKISKRLMALHPVAVNGDEIYVRMPRAANEVFGRWQNFWSGYNSGRAFETLWYLYDADPDVTTIRFNCTPFKNPGEDERMQRIVEGWNERGTGQVFPFYIDEQQNVLPITKLILTDISGHELKTLDFSKQFSNLDGKRAETQRIPIFSLPAKL